MFNKTNAWELPFHPLFFGIYPVLVLYSINSGQVPVYAIESSFYFSAIVTVSLFALSYLAVLFWTSISSWKTFVKIVVLTIITSISYYGVYSLFQNSLLREVVRHRILLPVWMVMLIALTVFIIKPQPILDNLKKLANLERAAAITSIILILFFSYGHVSGMMGRGGGFIRVMQLHQKLMVVWGILLAAGIFMVSRIKNISIFTKGANVTACVLCVMALAQITFWTIQHSNTKAAHLTTPTNLSPSSTNDPDVYYIILDAYSRDDVLREDLGFDNSDFISNMKAMGFVFPACTRSNYHETILSLASTLNMNYLDKLPPNQRNLPKFYDYVPYLQQNLVQKIFEERGYESYTFKGIFPFMNITNSSHYYDLFADEGSKPQIESQNFYFIFLQTTALRPALDYIDRYETAMDNLPLFFQALVPTKGVFSSRFYKQYQQSLYHLGILEKIPDMPGKKFVYAHFYITHEPYVFTADGGFHLPATSEEQGYYAQGYRNQILFINSRLPQILQKIIAKSKTPPIIIVQGDHGWVWGERRNLMLNAYYLPDGGEEMLYSKISPVNTFRIIMNKYFDGDYELLPDISYYGNFNDEDMGHLKIAQDTCVDK
jgi:hypothetical protein